MHKNKFDEIIITEDEAFRLLYSGKINDLSAIKLSDSLTVSQFNSSIFHTLIDINPMKEYHEESLTIEEFDERNQEEWFMPDSAKNVDIKSFILNLCSTPEEINRVNLELELFEKNKMMPLLNYLKYLVELFRENNIVWGVGRGSSVSSYVLYLLGVHKINSLQYSLDIHEFFK